MLFAERFFKDADRDLLIGHDVAQGGVFFLQLLDAGRLQDKYTEEDIAFRDTIVIFTTNVGKMLYDNENNAGVHQANAAFHRNTILDALRSERDPRTGEPHFPAAICSRMATGYPILFNHLRVPELARVAESGA
ncbi:MAG: AAA family ATPase [Proteobacteria bacterium]|nr:AAA family ATPase [Pseudomonadota bacterium]